MGWKTVKERYQIGHIVHIRRGNLCVGSPYCTELIVVGVDGQIKEPYERHGTNKDLIRYMKEFTADPQALADAIAAEDTFERSLPTYTYSGEDGVVEKFCEERGWPNITHDGELMYENTFFETHAEAWAQGVREEEGGIRFADEQIERLEGEIRKTMGFKAQYQERLDKLRSLPSA